MAVGRGLYKTITWVRPSVLMAVLCLMQLYSEYLGPIRSISVASLSNFGLDLMDTMLSILTIGMRVFNIHFIPRLCRCISASLTVYLSCSVGASCGIACIMVLLELYAPTFGDIEMPADDYCLYHCFNYVGSNGASPLTQDYARRFQERIVQDMRRDGLSAQAPDY